MILTEFPQENLNLQNTKSKISLTLPTIKNKTPQRITPIKKEAETNLYSWKQMCPLLCHSLKDICQNQHNWNIKEILNYFLKISDRII